MLVFIRQNVNVLELACIQYYIMLWGSSNTLKNILKSTQTVFSYTYLLIIVILFTNLPSYVKQEAAQKTVEHD